MKVMLYFNLMCEAFKRSKRGFQKFTQKIEFAVLECQRYVWLLLAQYTLALVGSNMTVEI